MIYKDSYLLEKGRLLNRNLLGLLCLLFLISDISLISAKEFSLKVDEVIVVESETIKLLNVGSGGSVKVDVSGIIKTIPFLGTNTINDIEITVVDYHYDYNDVSLRSTRIDIHKPGLICYVDNFCDYKEIEPWNEDTLYYRGKTIEIVDPNPDSIDLKVNEIEITLNAPSNSQNPLSTVAVIDGIGLRYNLIGDTELLYLGENFENCLSDCPLDEEDDSRLIKDFCQNNEKDDYTKEEGVDCDGLCERNCDQECLNNIACDEKCNGIEGSVVGKTRTCYCENYKCIDISYCETDSGCVQVENDACNCNFVSVNKDHEGYWNKELREEIGSKSCSQPCKFVEYKSVCKANMCKLTEDVEEEIIETSVYELLDTVVQQGDYTLVVGDEAPASDSLAATDIAVGLQGYSKGSITLKAQLASEVTDKSKMILLGRSCDNSLIDLSCESWPYKEGETLIKVDNDNLIIAGTTAEDTRSTAKIIAKYKDYSFLKESYIILVTKSGLEIPGIIAEPKSEIKTIVCGDGICDTGENISCYEDCQIEEVSNVTEEENVSRTTEEGMVEPEEEKGENAPFLKKIWEWILKWFKK